MRGNGTAVTRRRGPRALRPSPTTFQRLLAPACLCLPVSWPRLLAHLTVSLRTTVSLLAPVCLLVSLSTFGFLHSSLPSACTPDTRVWLVFFLSAWLSACTPASLFPLRLLACLPVLLLCLFCQLPISPSAASQHGSELAIPFVPHVTCHTFLRRSMYIFPYLLFCYFDPLNRNLKPVVDLACPLSHRYSPSLCGITSRTSPLLASLPLLPSFLLSPFPPSLPSFHSFPISF